MNFNDIMNNPNNIYYGHGVGGFDENKITSIFNNGLRCSGNGASDGQTALYYTTEILGVGKQIDEEQINMLKNWPHLNSTQVVIVSLPNKYNIFESIGSNTHRMANSAYYYIPDENKINDEKLTKTNYLMPEFILGYYDSETNLFYKNKNYYELLSHEEQERLFEKVKRNYVSVLEQSCGVQEYKEIVEQLPGWTFPLTDAEIEKYTNNSLKYNDDDLVNITTIISTINPELLNKKMKLPNGIEISATQYIQEIVYPKLPMSGIVFLNNGNPITFKEFIENYVMIECQEKYKGDFAKYIFDKTRSNIGVISYNNNDTSIQINPVEITDYIDSEILNKNITLPNGSVITAKQYIQEFYAPHIPANGIVTLSNGEKISVKKYIEDVLLGENQTNYNGDISQILYNTTKNNNGTIISNPKIIQQELINLKNQVQDFSQMNKESISSIHR